MKDVCDGAALLSVVHYYCPDVMKLEGTSHSLLTVKFYFQGALLGVESNAFGLNCKNHHQVQRNV